MMTTLLLDEQQQLLQRTARDFVLSRTPVAAFRALREDHEDGFDRALWREMAELGWAGLCLPESLGGLGLGLAELGVVMEQLGAQLVATPLLSTVALAADVLLALGDEGQRAQLSEVAEGRRILSLAYQEGAHHVPSRCATRAAATAGGRFRLHGHKSFVLDGHVADALLVVARTAGADDDPQGLTLFQLDPRAPGVRVERLGLVDGRNAAEVTLEGVEVEPRDVIGEQGAAGAALERTFARAATLLAAEMLGGMQAAFAMTVEYLKTRKQFGVLIGTFQGLKHRAADLYCELELTRSAVLDALRALDEERADAALAASVAKARASDVYVRAAAEGIQMHGGIGMTDEHDIGLYYKRARVSELLLGDGDYHRARFASLSGY